MHDQELLEQIDRYKFYHTIKLTESVSTPGVPHFKELHEPVYRVMDRVDFSGRSVLDIGCRDGLFSFEAERRGAASVMGIDNCLSVGAVELLIPFLKSKVRMQEMGLYELAPERLGRFDVVLFLGVLYHLRYPFYALRVIADVLEDGGTMILETGIRADDDERAMLFCPIGDESPYEPSSCTFFNRKGMIDTLRSLGMAVDHVEHMQESHEALVGGEIIRCTFLCRKDPELLKDQPHDYWLGGTHRTWRRGD